MSFNTNPQEESAIRLKIEAYVAGFLGLDSQLLREAFDQDSKLIAINEGKVDTTPTSSWFDRVDKRKAEGTVQPPATCNIAVIDQHGDAAMARVDLDFSAHRFTDYLSLLKTKDGWKIVNKIYTMA